jgi:ribose transport system substrate-binding protein
MRLGFLVAAGAATLMAAGCAKTSSTPSTSTGGAKIPSFAQGFRVPASGCGSYSAAMPADPDGVIAKLDAAHQDALRGYADFPGSTVKVLKSRWATWKPSHPGPYTVGISWGQLVSDFQVQVVDNLKKDLAATPGVGKVVARTTGSNLDIAQQLQQYNSLVAQKPDLIILESPSGDSFDAPVQKAAAQGIPTVTLLTPVPVDGAVNVDGNNYLGAGDTASYVSKLLGGRGSVLAVRALAVAAVDTQMDTVWKKVIAGCSQMKIAGEVFGAFSEPTAKSETLKFLGTHPAKIDAVGVMPGEAVGVMQAFRQVGRPIPPLFEIGQDKGLLGHWRANQASYHAASTSLPPVPAARAVAEIAGRMLAGQGVRLNTLIAKTPVVTDANLAQWSDPSWSLATPGTVSGKPDSFMPSSFIDAFFTHPAPLKQ